MPSPSPLLRNILLFGRLLRAMGLPVTSGQLMELARSLEYLELGRREDVRNAARCLLVSRQVDLARFDYAFDLFWRAWSQGEDNRILHELVERISAQAPHQANRAPSLPSNKPSQG